MMTKSLLLTGLHCSPCHVIFRRTAPAFAVRRFRLDRDGSGGGDTKFLSAVYRAGGVDAHVEKALVTEPVADNRAKMSGILQLYFRFGETHGPLLMKNGIEAARRIRLASIASRQGWRLLARQMSQRRCLAIWPPLGTSHSGIVYLLPLICLASDPANRDKACTISGEV